jgi:hypothetical protein
MASLLPATMLPRTQHPYHILRFDDGAPSLAACYPPASGQSDPEIRIGRGAPGISARGPGAHLFGTMLSPALSGHQAVDGSACC